MAISSTLDTSSRLYFCNRYTEKQRSHTSPSRDYLKKHEMVSIDIGIFLTLPLLHTLNNVNSMLYVYLDELYYISIYTKKDLAPIKTC